MNPLGRQHLSEITSNYERERAKRNTEHKRETETESGGHTEASSGREQTSSALIKN